MPAYYNARGHHLGGDDEQRDILWFDVLCNGCPGQWRSQHHLLPGARYRIWNLLQRLIFTLFSILFVDETFSRIFGLTTFFSERRIFHRFTGFHAVLGLTTGSHFWGGRIFSCSFRNEMYTFTLRFAPQPLFRGSCYPGATDPCPRLHATVLSGTTRIFSEICKMCKLCPLLLIRWRPENTLFKICAKQMNKILWNAGTVNIGLNSIG